MAAQPALAYRWCGLALVSAVAACEPAPPETTATTKSGVLYGEDDRREIYELDSVELQNRLARSVVALIPRASLDATGSLRNTPTLAERATFCGAPRFGEQPTAALCTGVLLDWDLILTAGHCTRALALDRLVAVFGYHYRAPGELAISPDAIFELAEIVAERLDPSGSEPRLDYAWIRLSYDVAPPLEPLGIALEPARAEEPLIVAATSSGLPLKVDQAARVRGAGAPLFDFFRAESDTSHGASGGPALDAQHAVLGILSRGGEDFVATASGCLETVTRSEDAAEEQYTYAARALEGLCSKAGASSSLCRAECGKPCLALPPSPPDTPPSEGACSMSRQPGQRDSCASVPLAVLVVFGLRWTAGSGRRPGRLRRS